MEETGQKRQDQGDGASSDTRKDKSRSPKGERVVSNQSEAWNTSRAQTPVNSSTTYTAPEQTYFYGGYGDGSINWGENSNNVHTNNLHIMSPAIYNDNGSLLFNPAYGFDPYGQFSSIASPLSPVMIDGQLYSPHQFPVSPYYTQPVSSTDLATPATSSSSSQEGFGENMFFGPGVGYYLHYPGSNSLGFYNGLGESVSNQSTPVGILGPYDNSFGQTPYHGYGFLSNSSTRRYPQNGSYEGSRVNHHGLDKEGKHRDRDSVSLTSDRNRGPRALKPKGSSPAEHTLNHVDIYNRPDFGMTYEKAKFFVIKSFSEDNVHRSIKYGVWASTSNGNRKLDAAYQEAKRDGDTCRIFLFFSVNASGQFCGVAEMIGPVDFENDADYWQQDRWSGQFRVKWHIVKDVPNSRFRHILLENNENKPVTHSRDSQEVKLEEGNAVMKIFKEFDADTSVVDDFVFYDEREKSFKEKRAKEQVSLTKKSVDAALINKLSDRVADSLQLEKHKEVQ